MATTIQSICDRALQIAENIGGERLVLDEPTAELLLPHVLKKVLLDIREGGDKIQSLIKSVSVTFTGGAADLPPTVMTEFSDYLQMENPNSPEAEEISYLPHSYDLRRNLPVYFDYFAIENNKILYKQAYEDLNTFSGDRILKAVIKPTIPATLTATWQISEDFAEDLAIELARALRGEPPYINLGEEKEKD